MTLTVRDVLGPTLTTEQMKALGGAYADFPRRFAEGSDGLHARGAQDVYYDGGFVHYAEAESVRSSDPARALLYERRGDELELKYIGQMDTVPDSYTGIPKMITVWEVFPDGLAIHYLRDPKANAASLVTIEQLANAMWKGWGEKTIFHAGVDLNDSWEPRYMGRIINTFTIASRLGIASPNTPIVEGAWLGTPPAWDALARQIVTYTARAQNPDGAWRSSAYGGQQAAYNAGILLNCLLDFDRLLPGHPDVAPMVHRAVEFLRTQWTPTGFQYASGAFDVGNGNVGGTAPAKDLTGLLVTPVAWSATHGGRVTTAWAEEVFAQAVAGADTTGGKQFNQAFAKSYQAAALLHPPVDVKALLARLESDFAALKAALAP